MVWRLLEKYLKITTSLSPDERDHISLSLELSLSLSLSV